MLKEWATQLSRQLLKILVCLCDEIAAHDWTWNGNDLSLMHLVSHQMSWTVFISRDEDQDSNPQAQDKTKTVKILCWDIERPRHRLETPVVARELHGWYVCYLLCSSSCFSVCSTMTMEELLTHLINKTKYDCEEAHRRMVFASTGLAGLHIIKQQVQSDSTAMFRTDIAGVLICLEWGADLHMAQLMPLPLTISYSSKSRLVLPFWYRLTRLVSGTVQGPIKRL